MFLLASVSLSAQVVKGAGLWYFNGVPNVTPSVATGTEIAYSINNKALYKWNRTTSAWVVVVQDSSITNELQDLILSNDTLSLTLSDSIVLMAQYRNHVWEITNLSDTTSITGDIEGDIAYTSTGDTIAFRGATVWLPFTGGGGGGTFNSFNIAGDTGSSIVTDGQTVTIAGGYGINTAESGGTVTVTADTSQLVTPSDISTFVSGAVDSIAVLQDSIVVGYSEGVEVTRDTIGFPVPDIADIPGLADSLAAHPSGTGTNLRIPLWTGTNSLGNSTLLQSAAGLTLDANLAFRLTGGTTASRPTGAAGLLYYNTTLSALQYYRSSAWATPLLSATDQGIGFAGRLFYADATTGFATQSVDLFWDQSNSRLGIGTTSPVKSLDVIGTANLRAGVSIGSGYSAIAPPSGGAIIEGKLGIGTSSPSTSYQMSIFGSVFSYFTMNNTNSGTGPTDGFQFGLESTGDANLVLREAGALGIFTNNTQRMSISSAGLVGIGTASPDRLLHSEISGSATNTIGYTYRGSHITSSTAAAGFGAGIELEAESAGGTNRVSATIENPYTTATNAAEVSDLVFKTMRAGTLTESLRSLGNGTLQIATLTGTATQMVGATAGNILTTFSPGYGLAFASGALRADTTALKAQFLPLTLSGTTTVNTDGQTLRFRDAGGYPNIQMTSAYGIIESDANTYFLAGFPTVGTARAQAAELMVISAGAGGAVEIEADSIVIDATLPANTNATSVLVRDAVTKRLEEKAISALETTWLKTELEAGNTVSISGDAANSFEISNILDLTIGTTNDISLQSAVQAGIVAGTNAYIESGAGGIDISADNGADQIRLNGTVKLQAGTDNGAADLIAGYVDSVLTQVEIGAGVELSAGTLQTTQCFGYNSEALVALTAVTATPDTVFAADDLSPCNFAFDADTGSYTYTGETRYFKATIAGQVIGEGNGEYASFTLYKNGSPTNASSQVTLELDPVNFNTQAVIQLASGDVVNVRVLTTDPGGENFDILNYSLIITEI